jgi:hypothetical protein
MKRAMADQLLFDKLAYIDRLKRAGIDEGHARAHAEAMDEALRESLPTKADLATIKADIALVKADLVADIAAVKADLVADIALVKADLVADIAAVKADLVADIAVLRTEITRLDNKIELAVRDLTIRMGAVGVALFAALASIKFFG